MIRTETYRELAELSRRTGDETALAIGMAGRSFSLVVNDSRADEALPMAAQLREMAQRISCDAETRGILLNSAAFTAFAFGQFGSAMTTVDQILLLSPDCPEVEVTAALSLRGFLEVCLGNTVRGLDTIKDVFDRSRSLHPVRFASVQIYAAALAAAGLVDVRFALGDARAAWEAAEAFGDICGIVMASWAYGTTLARVPDFHEQGIAILRSVRATVHEHRLGAFGLTTIDTDLAVEAARAGDNDEAIGALRSVYSRALSGFPVFAVFPAEALVDLLVGRGSAADIAEAKRTVQRWRARGISVPALDLWVLRAQALIAAAEHDTTGYDGFAADYLNLCEQLSAVGRIDEARQMAASGAHRTVG